MNPSARNQNSNGSTDLGLMQINSSWIDAARLDKERLISDACYNTLAGARILRSCIDRHGYTWEAVGCYNASNSAKRRIYAWKVFRHLVAESKKKQPSDPELLAPTGGIRLDASNQKHSSLSISIDEPGEDGQLAKPPGPAASRVALDRKEVMP